MRNKRKLNRIFETLLSDRSPYKDKSFGDFACDVREACGMTQKELAQNYGCSTQHISRNLENPTRPSEAPQDFTILQWGIALDLTRPQIDLCQEFANSKRVSRKDRRGDFSPLLQAYMTTHNIQPLALAQKSEVRVETIKNILKPTADGPVPHQTTIDALVTGLRAIQRERHRYPKFTTVDEFYAVAGKLVDQPTVSNARA